MSAIARLDRVGNKRLGIALAWSLRRKIPPRLHPCVQGSFVMSGRAIVQTQILRTSRDGQSWVVASKCFALQFASGR